MPGVGHRAGHRIRQFFGALRPHVDAEYRGEAYRYLTPDQRALFESMMLRDQEHGIVVFQRVRDGSSADDAGLFTAALLHDCGKGRVGLWQRVVYVILGGIAPSVLHRLASECGAGWRQGFWRLLHHPRLGADAVAATGADPAVVRMIREQDSPAPDARLALLQAADDA